MHNRRSFCFKAVFHRKIPSRRLYSDPPKERTRPRWRRLYIFKAAERDPSFIQNSTTGAAFSSPRRRILRRIRYIRIRRPTRSKHHAMATCGVLASKCGLPWRALASPPRLPPRPTHRFTTPGQRCTARFGYTIAGSSRPQSVTPQIASSEIFRYFSFVPRETHERISSPKGVFPAALMDDPKEPSVNTARASKRSRPSCRTRERERTREERKTNETFDDRRRLLHHGVTPARIKNVHDCRHSFVIASRVTGVH